MRRPERWIGRAVGVLVGLSLALAVLNLIFAAQARTPDGFSAFEDPRLLLAGLALGVSIASVTVVAALFYACATRWVPCERPLLRRLSAISLMPPARGRVG